MDREVFLWLVSTAPQVLAALVGLSFAAMTFRTSSIDNLISKDDTLSDIEAEVKRLIFKGFKFVLIFGVSVIAIDLELVASAGQIYFSSVFGGALISVFLLLNAIGLVSICAFMITVGNPEYHKVAARNLIQLYGNGPVAPANFIMHFRDLEVALRKLYPPKEQQKPLTARDMIRLLAIEEKINKNELDDLLSINRLRNLIVHGEDIVTVEKNIDDRLKEYTRRVEEYAKAN